MNRPTPRNTATLPTPNLITLSALQRGFYVVVLAFALTCFALLQTTQAVTPAPDGGYPNGNTAEGDGALASLTTGHGNTAVGFQALFSNTSAGDFINAPEGNTAVGYDALFSNTIGFDNVAIGSVALADNTIGAANTAIGASALRKNRTAQENTATGNAALFSNTTGSFNTATGLRALASNTIGSFNTATGSGALSGSTGNDNTANGYEALLSNTTGNGNTANGTKALFHNTAGSNNTANGINAMFFNTTGNSNIAQGRGALGNNTSGSFNLAVGFNAGSKLTTGSNNIDIGAVGVAGESNTMQIGTAKQTVTFITGIRGVTTANANAVPVVIDSTGQLGTVSSSRRFKDDVKPMDKASEDIMALKPVTFHYKNDSADTPQFGLIAEEVAKVNSELVVRDEKGEIYTVRYEAVNAMLLNEFLKEHRKVEEQGATIGQMQKQIATLTATVQKVSDQMALSKPAQQSVTNP